MDERHPPIPRWPAVLGLLLILEGILAGRPFFVQAGPPHPPVERALQAVFFSLFPLFAGIATVCCARFRTGPRVWLMLFWLAWAIASGPILTGLVRSGDLLIATGRSPWLFAVAASLILEGAVAALWGGALRLRVQPGSALLQTRLRVAAGLVQLAFVALVVHNGAMLMNSGSRMPTGTVDSLCQITSVTGELLLLWSSIVAVRAATEPSVVHRRADRIHRLMLAWIGLAILNSLLTSLLLPVTGGDIEMKGLAFRRLLLEAIPLTATLTAVLSIAQRIPRATESAGPASASAEPPPAPAA